MCAPEVMVVKEQRCLLASDCFGSSLCAPEGEPVMPLLLESGRFWTERRDNAIHPRETEEREGETEEREGETEKREGAGSAACSFLID